MISQKSIFHPFESDFSKVDLPETFTFPFFYDPHPLCRVAADQLMAHIEAKATWNKSLHHQVGKMFGVLIVKNQRGVLGYLAAFSGKLDNSVHHSGFVPPVFDMLDSKGFYRQGEEELNQLNQDIQTLESSTELAEARFQHEKAVKSFQQFKSYKNQQFKEAKQQRKISRAQAITRLNETDYAQYCYQLDQERIQFEIALKKQVRQKRQEVEVAERNLLHITNKIDQRKSERQQKSALLQKKLFEHYQFLNARGEWSSLQKIFGNIQPPSGAGDCAAPKLLQYAFLNGLQPIAMAEFWWGASPKSEIRKHGQYYPACRGKCQPILGHMLQGLKVNPNPILDQLEQPKQITTLFEDENIIVIHKPSNLLSVPGKEVQDSVWLRIKERIPNPSGPLIIHRLDMSTSGIMVLAKNKTIHKVIQQQFINRTVKKRYVAILDGNLQEDKGSIHLPLRVDLEDRPRQLVCYTHGKPATTYWKVINRQNGKTKVHFFPFTGRTHQLRVHAAHQLGLNTPILGDDLYGNKANRLYLHADYLEFVHPSTGETVKFNCPSDF